MRAGTFSSRDDSGGPKDAINNKKFCVPAWRPDSLARPIAATGGVPLLSDDIGSLLMIHAGLPPQQLRPADGCSRDI
jgi:hypothetical protein